MAREFMVIKLRKVTN